jgi:tRNA-specific 2-thiouridylase
MRKRVLVGISGGVNSAVAAALLKSQGFEVHGVHLQLWNPERIKKKEPMFQGRCCKVVAPQEIEKLCDKIDIPFKIIPAYDEFEDKVEDFFVHTCLQSLTPNPCFQCNVWIKFPYLLKAADQLGFDLIATGHSAQVIQELTTGKAHLHKAADPKRDQSYFLFAVSAKALARTLMPLGNLQLLMIQRLAIQFDLRIDEKEDHQEICFNDPQEYRALFQKKVPLTMRAKGLIRATDASIIGEHDGIFEFRLGQRLSQRLPNAVFSVKNPEDFFVLGFDPAHAELIVGPEEKLFQKELQARHVRFLHPVEGLREIRCKAKLSPKHTEAWCQVCLFENNTANIRFEDPQRVIAAGQSIVFYREDEVLGGGLIDRIIENK